MKSLKKVFRFLVIMLRLFIRCLDDVKLTDVLVCGGSDGYLRLLPLPLLSSSSSSDTFVWESSTFFASNCAISSMNFSWRYLYTGFVDGSVKVWTVSMMEAATGGLQDLFSSKSGIKTVSLVLLNNQLVHAGPVTAIQSVGGHLFTSSHDFSLLPWKKPEKLNAKSEGDFTQTPLVGYVIHSHPVICMACNPNMIVSGDEHGEIVVSAPSVSSEFLSG